jgi:RNA polymerase sigma-70 factor (ECF subfamily)
MNTEPDARTKGAFFLQMSTYSPQTDQSNNLPDEAELLAQLRDGSEDAFALLVDRYQKSMLRVALMYVDTDEIAQDVVQEAWLGFLKGLDKFEGRSSLRTWLFSILVNRAKTRAEREHRSIPLSTFEQADLDEPVVDPARFRPADDPRWPHHWADAPRSWDNMPEAQLLSNETLNIVQEAIESLSPNQREVITLRDIEGWTSDEVCNVLAISETNQRVLLHRARSAVRQTLEDYLGQGVKRQTDV